MKVKVTVDLSSGLERVPSFNLVVGAKDTVASLKERVATVSLVPFPDQVLSLENQALPDDALLVGCGVEDGSSLVLSAKPSIDTFLRQLEELLSSREMSKDELCLLYCYKHGVSVSQVLKALGLRHLEDLLSRGKSSIQVSSGRWRLGTEARLGEPKGDLDDLCAVNQSSENQRYIDLHSSICSRAFNSKASRALVELVEDLQKILPLHIHQAVKGGSMGKGTATSAGPKRPDAEVVFFLHAANPETLLREKWLPPLLKASADILKSKYQVELMEDSLRLHSLPTLRVTLRFAPAMSLIQTKALAKNPSSWRLFQCSFVEQRVHFVAKQPGSVKMTIRLLKWWRDQQEWSAPLYQPSDEILELFSNTLVWLSAEGLTAPTGSSLTLDGPRILWPDLSLKQICVAEPGGEAKALVKNLQSPNSVAVGDGQVYWGDFGTRKIHKLSTSGGSNEVIVPYGKNSTSLVVDTARGKLYWTNFGTNAIYRANLDGRDMQPLITDLESPSALALASKAGKLYWLERPRGKLRRASVEGSQVEDVLSNLPDPWALAVLDVGEAQVVPIEKYSWTDEGSFLCAGEVLKVYISESSNPAAVAAAGSAGCLLSVDFQPRGFTLMVRSDGPQFQLRILGLLQEVLPEKCKVRLSVGKRITLSLAKKDPKTAWSALCHRS